MPISLPDQVRDSCAWVAERASSVRIDEAAIGGYARGLTGPEAPAPPDPQTELLEGGRETRAAFAICLNAINFGSGWWPTIRKRPGLSGYSTVAAGVVDRFLDAGPWSAAELEDLSTTQIASALGQDPDHPLMSDFARSLRDVGVHVRAEHEGRFETVVDASGGSAVALTDLLASWRAFADTSTYLGRTVPFFKRAQLAAADLDRAGVASFPDLERLTAFADNLVPHVLRVDGVLQLDPALEQRIEAGELLEHGSPEEVALRACTVHTIELLVATSGGRLTAAEIDVALWNRGRAPRYKSIPRPRSRNTAY
ncbi:MAG TPA: queuosine salvage family protein [Solirubrobacterales bacterium]|nr:queuosine salvage family protein [Solirubrobacterales bacterium]